MKIKKLLFIAGLTFFGFIGSSSTVSAQQTRFALACIQTRFNATSFAYRWGNGHWTNTSVPRGKWHYLAYRYNYPGENRSPRLQIMFDKDISRNTNITYVNLEANAARYSNWVRLFPRNEIQRISGYLVNNLVY